MFKCIKRYKLEGKDIKKYKKVEIEKIAINYLLRFIQSIKPSLESSLFLYFSNFFLPIS